MSRRRGPIILLLLAAFGSTWAQFPTATVSGTVCTEDGQPVPDATVQWIHNGHSISLTTDSGGRFSFHFALPGRQVIRFEHASTSAIGVFEILVDPMTAVQLAIILSKLPENSRAKNTWILNSQWAKVVNTWQSERVLTEKQVESLPSTEHIWAFLNHTESSVVADRYDISGMHSHRQLLLGVRGSSWTQNQTLLNGLTVSHPSGEGTLAFPDMSAMETIVYTVGDSLTRHTGPGAHLALLPKTGQSERHGQAYGFMQSGALQNVNPTKRQRFFGIKESDERWRHYINAGFQLGGPLGNGPWTYFGSFATRDFEKRIRNHALPVSAAVNQWTFNLSGKVTPVDRLGFYGLVHLQREPRAGASPQVTREASLDQKQNMQILQAVWSRFLSSRSSLDARIGVARGRMDARFAREAHAQSQQDLFAGYALWGVPDPPSPSSMVGMLNNTSRGAAPLATDWDTSSWEGGMIYSTVRPGAGDSSHRLTLGTSFRRMSLGQLFSAIDGVNLLFFQSAPESVRLLNTPARTRDRVSQFEWHTSDNISFGRLGFTLALNGNSSSGLNLLDSWKASNVLKWNNVSGRIGVAYQLSNRRPLVVRAGLARIYSQPLVRTWSAVNPAGVGVQLYAWEDKNGDAQFQLGENSQILKVYGSPYTQLDPDLRNPRTSEIILGLTQGGLGGISFHALGFRRFEHQLISLVNVGVPFSSYWPVQVLDPGPDGQIGEGGDDELITVFNQKPETLGKDRYLLTNPPGLSGFSEGFELKLAFSFRRFQAEAAMTRYRAVAATPPGISVRENDTSTLLGVFDDPNKAILARGSTYFDRGTLGRLWAVSDLGKRIFWSLLISYQDGLPFSRYLPIKGLNQGVIGVLTRQRGPGDAGSFPGFMTTHYRTIDTRLWREFPLPNGNLVATLDIFNLTNLAQSLLPTDVTAPTHLWRIPLRFQTPRSLQLGLRYKW